MRLLGVAIRRFRLAEDLYLPIEAGAVNAILGPNDAGKSTLLDAVASLTEPSGIDDTIVVAYFRAGEEADLAIPEIRARDDPPQLVSWIEEHTDFGRNAEELWSAPLEPLTNRAKQLVEQASADRTFAISNYGPALDHHGAMLTRWLATLPEVTLDARAVLDRLVQSDAEWLQAELVLRRILAASEEGPWQEIVWDSYSSGDAYAQYREIRDQPGARPLFADAPEGDELARELFVVGPALRFFADRLDEPWLRESLIVPIGWGVGPLKDILAADTRPGDLDKRLRSLCDRIAAAMLELEQLRAAQGAPKWLDRLQEIHERGLLSDPGVPDSAEPPAGDEEPEDVLLSRVHSLRGGATVSDTQPWFVVRSESPYRLERMIEIDRMAEEIQRIATALLPPFLTTVAGVSPEVVIELGDQDVAAVLVRWEGQEPVPVDQIAEGYRLWVALAVCCAIRHVERWLERDWAMGPLVGVQRVEGKIGAYESVGPLPRDRLTHWTQPRLQDLLVLIDEPERHLHPAQQRKAATWLGQFASAYGLTILLATHAPAFLALDDTSYHEIRRGPDGRLILEPVDPRELQHQQAIAARLGFDRGELSHQYRAMLLVEGTHDEIVLEEWFGRELREARVLVLPTRGTKNLASVTWALEGLLRFIDLPIGFLLDEDESIQRVRRLADRLKSEVPATRRDELLSAAERKTYKRYHDFVNLLAYGQLDREVQLWSHNKPDIVFFLDEQFFRDRSPSYTHAGAEARLDERKDTGIKPWVKQQWNLGDDFFADENIRRIAHEGQKTEDQKLTRIISEIRAWALSERPPA